MIVNFFFKKKKKKKKKLAPIIASTFCWSPAWWIGAQERSTSAAATATCCAIGKPRIDARGIESAREGVNACVANGLSVVQGDADTDLRDYPDSAFDYVILSQTLQATREPREVLAQMLRVGKRAIVSFPNFAHWQVRLQLLFGGRMPRTDAALQMVRHAQHPSLHHRRFPRSSATRWA